MGEDKDKENEIHERNVSYNTKRKSDKIKEEISIDIENNQEEEDNKEKIIDRMVDRNIIVIHLTKQSRVHKQNSSYPLLKIELSMIYKHYYHKDKIGFGVFYMSVINTIHQ